MKLIVAGLQGSFVASKPAPTAYGTIDRVAQGLAARRQ